MTDIENDENDDDDYEGDFDSYESNCSDTDASTKEYLDTNLLLSSPPQVIGGTTSTISDVNPVLSPSRQIRESKTRISWYYEKKVEKLKCNMRLLERRNRCLTREIKILRRRNVDTSESVIERESTRTIEFRNKHFKTQIVGALNAVLDPFRHWKGPIVAKVVWDQLDGALQPHLLQLARKHFRAHLFTPFNIIREMDLAGGTLSYEGIDVIRRVETSGVKRFRGSMIPSKSEIKRMAARVEWFGIGITPSNQRRKQRITSCKIARIGISSVPYCDE
jgi:hypothetical protein